MNVDIEMSETKWNENKMYMPGMVNKYCPGTYNVSRPEGMRSSKITIKSWPDIVIISHIAVYWLNIIPSSVLLSSSENELVMAFWIGMYRFEYDGELYWERQRRFVDWLH